MINYIFKILLTIALLIFTNSCEVQPDKELQMPHITTMAVTNVTSSSAVSGGFIDDNNGSFPLNPKTQFTYPIFKRGVCWSLSNPPLPGHDSITIDQNEEGKEYFISHMTGLIPDTTYYVNAYYLAKTFDMTTYPFYMYGGVLSFKTLPDNE